MANQKYKPYQFLFGKCTEITHGYTKDGAVWVNLTLANGDKFYKLKAMYGNAEKILDAAKQYKFYGAIVEEAIEKWKTPDGTEKTAVAYWICQFYDDGLIEPSGKKEEVPF